MSNATTTREYRCSNASCAEHLVTRDVPAYESHGRAWPDEGRLACESCGEQMEETPDVIIDEIGRGQLRWPQMERVSGRYGCLLLYTENFGVDESDHADGVSLETRPGAQGTLKAEILKTHQSYHPGDLLRGYRVPRQQLPVGAIITLGYGKQFAENVKDIDCVGVCPLDDPATDWLDPSALYKLYNQTVRLFFEREL